MNLIISIKPNNTTEDEDMFYTPTTSPIGSDDEDEEEGTLDDDHPFNKYRVSMWCIIGVFFYIIIIIFIFFILSIGVISIFMNSATFSIHRCSDQRILNDSDIQ